MPHPNQNNARPLRRIVTIADSVNPEKMVSSLGR